MSHVTVVAGLLLTLDHYQSLISLKFHIKYCTLDDKIVALWLHACSVKGHVCSVVQTGYHGVVQQEAICSVAYS